MPNLLRFLLLSATPLNIRRIIYQIRAQLKFIGLSNSRAMQHNKLKGKALVDSSEASILGALKSSLHFKNVYIVVSYASFQINLMLFCLFLTLGVCCMADTLPGDFERTEMS